MTVVILGVDPGSRHTGFGVFQGEGDRLQHLASGSIKAGASPPLASSADLRCWIMRSSPS